MKTKLALRGDFIAGMRVESEWRTEAGTTHITGDTVCVFWDGGAESSFYSQKDAHEYLTLVGLPEGARFAVVEGEVSLDRALLGEFEVES